MKFSDFTEPCGILNKGGDVGNSAPSKHSEFLIFFASYEVNFQLAVSYYLTIDLKNFNLNYFKPNCMRIIYQYHANYILYNIIMF